MPALLHSAGYYVDPVSRLRLYVPQAEIRERLPGFALGRTYTVRATVLLEIGEGGQPGYWSPGFIERVFPVRERVHTLTRRVTF
jgi:hypothetical protein